MTVRNPLILVSGVFSQLPASDTVPGTDVVAQASGNAALVLGATALSSGNAALSGVVVAQSSGNAALFVGTTALASGNAALVDVVIAQASGNAALVVADSALTSGTAALASGNAALLYGVNALPYSGGVITGDIGNTASGYLGAPVGTTTERPAVSASGLFRFNSTINQFEGSTGTAWRTFGGARGGGSDEIFSRTIRPLLLIMRSLPARMLLVLVP